MGLTRLYLAQRGLCFLCLKPMLYRIKRNGRRGGDCYTREHVYPRAKGGGMGKNIVLSHARCNVARGNALPTPEMEERAKAIWDRAVRFTNYQVQTFTSDRAVEGTYCHTYKWPGPGGLPVFDPNTVKLLP